MSKKTQPVAGHSPYKQFGEELARWRNLANLSQSDLGDRLNISPQMISHYETGNRLPGEDRVKLIDEILGCDGALTKVWPGAEGKSYPTGFLDWLTVEREATYLGTWQPLVIPGLLQTPEYARIVYSGVPGILPEQVSDRVDTRISRQAILIKPNPPMFGVLLDEGILSRQIGSAGVMRGQIERLIEAAALANVSIHMVPLDASVTDGLLGAFTIAHLPNGPDTVYLESAANPQVTAAFAEVSMIKERYGNLGREAHSRNVSLQLMKEAASRWTRV